jgi:hypothetical protein
MAPELYAWPNSPEELLRLIESYARQRELHPTVKLLIFGRYASKGEIQAVLRAEKRPDAARVLFAEKINRFD